MKVSRRARYYLARSVFALALLSAMASVWQQYETVRSGSHPSDKRIFAAFAADLLQQIGQTQFFAMHLLIPLFVCGVIATERREGTLELLLVTELSDREIVLGKLASRLAVTALLVVSGIPVMSLVVLLGGVRYAAIVQIECAALLAVLFVSSVSIFFATVCRSTLAALLATYASIAICVALYRPSPLVAFMIAMQTNRSFDSSLFTWTEFIFASIVPLGISIVLITSASKALRRLPTAASETPEFAVARLKRVRPPNGGGIESGRRENGKTLPSLERAAALLHHISAQCRESVWILLAAFGVCTYLVKRLAPPGSAHMGAALLPIWILVIATTVPLAVTNPLYTRRPGFFDHLLQTPLDPHEILRESILLNRPVLGYLFAAPCVLTFLLIAVNPIGLILAFFIGSLMTAAVLTLGNICSLVDHRPVHRIVPTLGFLAVLTAAPKYAAPLMGGSPGVKLCLFAIFFWLITSIWCRHRPAAWAVGCNFLAVYLILTATVVSLPADCLQIGDPQRTPLDAIDPFFWFKSLLWDFGAKPRGLSIWWLAPGYVIALGMHLLLIWWWTIRYFDHLVGRPTLG